jgi:hypothetical protein
MKYEEDAYKNDDPPSASTANKSEDGFIKIRNKLF